MNIEVIDQEFLGTKQVIASYLISAPEGPILVETGPATTQEVLEKKVSDLGVDPSEVKHVLVTHIHLDHSGGAGYWAKRGATIYVHPKGARHLISPERLLSSAARIYGEQMDYLWGETIAVPEEQVVAWEGGTTKRIAGLEIEALDTPGHASHHLAYRAADVIFTGDVGGCRLPGSEFVSVPGPPPEFHLEAWLQSLQLLQSRRPETLYLTHFGKVDDPVRHIPALKDRMLDCVEFVGANIDKAGPELEKLYQAWDREQAAKYGVDEETYEAYEKANPSFMSAQGIARYWSKKTEKEA